MTITYIEQHEHFKHDSVASVRIYLIIKTVNEETTELFTAHEWLCFAMIRMIVIYMHALLVQGC